MDQYAVAVAALVMGVCIGAVGTWAVLHRKYNPADVDQTLGVEIQRLEKQLHAQECECLDRLSVQKRELLDAHEAELRRAVAEARDLQRTELEAQVSMFTVKVSPYVNVTETRHRWRRRYKSVTGYQYQLLVNGIPAFAPHIIEDRVETSDTVDEQSLIQLASQAAELAVATFGGGASRVVAMAGPVVKGLGSAKPR